MTISLRELFQAGVDLLESVRVRYILIGGIAAGIWGDPRETKDADFVIALQTNDVGPLLRKAKELAFEIDEDVIRMNLEISGVARLICRGRYVDFIVGETEFDEEAMRRGRRVRLFDREVSVATPEDLILYKMVAQRDQDLADIGRVMARQGGSLDVSYMRQWGTVLSAKLHRPEIVQKLEDRLRPAATEGGSR